MRNIYAIGETVLDILFKDQLPVTAKAGGACLNSAVTLGRLNLPVAKWKNPAWLWHSE
jgi:fructokinase